MQGANKSLKRFQKHPVGCRIVSELSIVVKPNSQTNSSFDHQTHRSHPNMQNCTTMQQTIISYIAHTMGIILSNPLSVWWDPLAHPKVTPHRKMPLHSTKPKAVYPWISRNDCHFIQPHTCPKRTSLPFKAAPVMTQSGPKLWPPKSRRRNPTSHRNPHALSAPF